jgi:hypothetical protein
VTAGRVETRAIHPKCGGLVVQADAGWECLNCGKKVKKLPAGWPQVTEVRRPGHR